MRYYETHLLYWGTLMRIAFLALLTSLSACNNYDMLEKMKNPGTTELKSHYIFVSSYKTQGNMAGLANGGCGGGGTGQADCACRDMAKAAGLQGSENYIAWLSRNSPSEAAACRLQGINSATCGISAIVSWYNRKDELVAASLGELTSGTVKAPIRYTEHGNVTDAGSVFTGTTASGLIAPSHCSNWIINAGVTAITDESAIGDPNATNLDWSQKPTVVFCNQTLPIYCIRKP